MRSSILECAALKEQLLALLATADPVCIDVGDVEVVDTAALQLLFAFSRERTVNGLTTLWQGDNPNFRSAVAALALPLGDCPIPPTNNACQHVS